MGSSFDRQKVFGRGGGGLFRGGLCKNTAAPARAVMCLIWFNRTDCGYTLHKVRLLSYSHNQSHLVNLYTNEKDREQPQSSSLKPSHLCLLTLLSNYIFSL